MACIQSYQPKSSTKISDIYLEDISYQVYVLKKLGYNVQKASIIYINNSLLNDQLRNSRQIQRKWDGNI